MLSAFDRWLTRFEDLFAAIAVGGLLFLIGVVFLEIVLRTFFAMPQVWVIEFSEYALLWITFLGTSWLLRTEGHVAVDLLTNALPAYWKRRFAIVSACIGFVVALVLVVFGTNATIEQMRLGTYKPTIMEFPTWRVLLIIPIGSALLALRFLHRVVALARGLLEPR